MLDTLKSIVNKPKTALATKGDYTLRFPDGRVLDYTVKPAKRKSMAITLSGTGAVIVKCPHKYPQHHIERFLLEKSAWIFEKQRYYNAIPPQQKPPQFYDGSVHQIMGKPYVLQYEQGIRNYATLDYSTATLTVETTPKASIATIEKAVLNLYQRTAQTVFPERLSLCFEKFKDLNYASPQLTIKQFKGRWGSMSHDHKMMLNTWLIRAPLDCIDYVIIHELCHMKHMNHGAKFYALQSQKCPNWKTHKATLDKIQL